jgi:PIN domain nuclease of toxin-antitoxin system
VDDSVIKARLFISPMVVLELEYLYETGRTTAPSHVVVEDLKHRIDLSVADTLFIDVVTAARNLTWTRDPFDRLIAAQALVENAHLLTADRTIRDNLSLAIWD